MLEAADQALYRAKRLGRNCVEVQISDRASVDRNAALRLSQMVETH